MGLGKGVMHVACPPKQKSKEPKEKKGKNKKWTSLQRKLMQIMQKKVGFDYIPKTSFHLRTKQSIAKNQTSMIYTKNRWIRVPSQNHQMLRDSVSNVIPAQPVDTVQSNDIGVSFVQFYNLVGLHNSSDTHMILM